MSFDENSLPVSLGVNWLFGSSGQAFEIIVELVGINVVVVVIAGSPRAATAAKRKELWCRWS